MFPLICLVCRCTPAKDFLLSHSSDWQWAVTWLRKKVRELTLQCFCLPEINTNSMHLPPVISVILVLLSLAQGSNSNFCFAFQMTDSYSWSHTGSLSNESSSTRLFQRTYSAQVCVCYSWCMSPKFAFEPFLHIM